MKPKTEQGFTLIELLVVIVITSVLAAISYPSLLSQANKAKQSEAKQYTGTLNRVQQAYYLEKNEFAPDMTSLANPVPEATNNYDYAFAASPDNVINYGTSRSGSLKSYAGMAAIAYIDPISGGAAESGEATTTAILCESNIPNNVKAPDPSPPSPGSGDRPTCGDGSTAL